MNHETSITVGDTLTCAETGKVFVASTDGCSFNYAIETGTGRPLSDEGVAIRERRLMSDRSSPFGCYLSCDGKSVTGWKGNFLGDVVRSSVSRSGWHGSTLVCVTVRDVHGGYWHGRGSGRGMFIALRPSKSAR